MKVFLSHPMYGRTDEECLTYRSNALKVIQTMHPSEEVELLETFIHENAPKNATRQWHLGESIKSMGDADIVYFSKDYEQARGCRIEFQICLEYEIPYGILEI